MKLSTITQHKHEVPSRNCSHSNAWAIAEYITSWHPYNLLYWFQPPTLEGIVLMPNDPSQVDETEVFEASMFDKGGMLEDELLNHYVKLRVKDLPEPLMVNAAFLINNYLWGSRQGATVLKRLIERAKEKYWTHYQATTDSPAEV